MQYSKMLAGKEQARHMSTWEAGQDAYRDACRDACRDAHHSICCMHHVSAAEQMSSTPDMEAMQANIAHVLSQGQIHFMQCRPQQNNIAPWL